MIEMIPSHILNQVHESCSEGLALLLASNDDGAVMHLQWCNKAFTKVTGYSAAEAMGQRGTILIGPNMEQGVHLYIIEKLMHWENFSAKALNNRKNGEIYTQRMTWTHLSDSETGNRWWLCSIIDLEVERRESAILDIIPPSTMNRHDRAEMLEKIRRLEKENARLYQLAKSVARHANEDALTGLSNRRHFEVELKAWIADLKDGKEFAVLYIDLDRFKLINDSFGHDAGDRLLVSVARTLKDLASPSDLVARLGGDEFVILTPLGKSALSICGLADKLVQRLKAPLLHEGKTAACSASVGVAIAKAHMDEPERIVAASDEAMYHAKSQGRGRWSFFTEEMHANSIASKVMASDLLVACERQEFVPFFQPLIDANTGRIAGAEMLVRWAHPTKGILPPEIFIEVATEFRIIERIDEILFGGLKKALSNFDETGIELPRVAVNVSEARLADPSFIHDIKSSGIDPKRLTVELLESVYLDRMSGLVRRAVSELDSLGVTIALDDFGTEHASLRGLLEIRPAVLKIDRHFVQPAVTDESSRNMVASIIGIGKGLGMKVVAEGVETEEHARLVSEMGCDYLQGFYFGTPMSENELSRRLVETGGQFWNRRQRNQRRKGKETTWRPNSPVFEENRAAG